MLNAKKLKNGMRYHLVPFSGTEAVTVLVLTGVGSRNEELNVWGGSHYIEHLMFKGTTKRPNTIDISSTLDRYGAQYNAYTGKDLTGYYVKIGADHTETAVDLLHDMIFNSLYDPEEMTREKGVIIEEIKMYEENPIMHLDDLLERAMFEGHALGRDIAGTPESMTAMKREDVIAYRDRFYVPENMVVAIAGKIPENIEELLEKTFGSVKARLLDRKSDPFTGAPQGDKPRVARQYKPELKQIQVAIGFSTPGRDHEDEPALELLENILGGAMSSRLFIEVRERRGLCYTIRTGYDAYEDAGIFSVRAGLDAARLGLATETIFAELEKVKKEGVTDQELQYAKDHIEGSLKLRLENSSSRAEFYGRQELYFGNVHTLEERLEKFRSVTREDIQRVANKIIDFSKISIAAIGPYESDEALLKHFPVLK